MSVLEFLKNQYRKTSVDHARKILKKYDLEHHDEIKIRGTVSMGYGKHYEEITDIFGNKIMKPVLENVQWTKDNLIVIGGNQYVLCKMFNLPYTVLGGDVVTPISNVNPGVLNDAAMMNFDSKKSPPAVTGANLNPLHFINCFTVGYGGATESNLVARDVNYKGRMLYQPIPFRYTSANLNAPGRVRYGGIVTNGDKAGGQNVKSYYLKKFDSNPTAQIYHLWKDNGLQDGTPVTNTIFDTTEDNGMDIETYAEMELSIEPAEFREWFQTNLSGEPPRINELGLVSAYWDPAAMDALDAQLITHICFPTEPLHGVGSTMGAKSLYLLYRVYVK